MADVSVGDVSAVARDARGELIRITDELEPDAVEALLVLAWRLVEGRRRYGPLDLAHDRRDWRHERAEELADALIYTAFDEVSREARRHRGR